MAAAKIARVIEGECRDCGARWRIEFELGEEVWEPGTCPACWQELEVEVGSVADGDEPCIFGPDGELF